MPRSQEEGVEPCQSCVNRKMLEGQLVVTGNLEGGPFFPAWWCNDEGDAVLHGQCMDLFLFSELKRFEAPARVCSEGSSRSSRGCRDGLHLWLTLTNSLLCLSDQTAGSSLPCLAPHQYKLQGQLFAGTLLSSSIYPTSSYIHLTRLIIEQS